MWCTWKVVVLPIKPVVYFLTFSLRSLRWILKSLFSIYKIRPESFGLFVFFFFFIFNSVSLHEKAKFWRILKRAVFTMASLNLLHQIPSGFCSLLQVRAFNLLHQIPSGFALFCKLGLCLFLKSSVGLPNLNMREKMKLIPLLAKTSHRVIAN